MSAKEVAAHTSTDAFFVKRAIEQLVERGYVNRGVDEQDRRRLKLELTNAGKAVKADVEKVLSRVEEALLEHLPADDRQKVISMLESLDAAALSLFDGKATWRDYAR
jgi:DNA-binding MarR family transcriptional regulator